MLSRLLYYAKNEDVMKRPEIAKKVSDKLRGIKRNEETKKKLRKFRLGKSYEQLMGKMKSRYVKEKRSKTMRNFWSNPKNKHKIDVRNEKISLALKGKPRPDMFGDKNNMSNPEILKKVIQAIHKKPNIPEKQVMQIIKFNNLPFNYTGNGNIKGTIGSFNADFICVGLKKIIEVYGEYHHNLPRSRSQHKRRMKTYLKARYKILIIWSRTIAKNPQKVTEKIINFCQK